MYIQEKRLASWVGLDVISDARMREVTYRRKSVPVALDIFVPHLLQNYWFDEYDWGHCWMVDDISRLILVDLICSPVISRRL